MGRGRLGRDEQKYQKGIWLDVQHHRTGALRVRLECHQQLALGPGVSCPVNGLQSPQTGKLPSSPVRPGWLSKTSCQRCELAGELREITPFPKEHHQVLPNPAFSKRAWL